MSSNQEGSSRQGDFLKLLLDWHGAVCAFGAQSDTAHKHLEALTQFATPATEQAPQQDRIDAERLDWLGRAGDVFIDLVVDAPHDGELHVSANLGQGYGKTIREAIDEAMKGSAP